MVVTSGKHKHQNQQNFGKVYYNTPCQKGYVTFFL